MSEGFGEKGPRFNNEEESEERETSPLSGFQETTGPTKEQIKTALESESSFERENNRTYKLGMRNEKPYFTVTYKDQLPETLTAEEKSKFTSVGEDAYRFEYGKVPEEAASSEPYLVREPLRNEGGKLADNQFINEGKLAEMMIGKKVIFYTGAGISMDRIHGLSELMDDLEINIDKNEDGFLKTCVSDPKEIAEKWHEFKQSLVDSEPSVAHESLTKIAKQTNSPVITENSDLLHEKAGTNPFHVSGPKLKKQVKSEELRYIDMVVTIGLRADDRGFLAWYKDQNPNGIIVAINKKQAEPLEYPEYLGEDDMMIEGDLREIVPQLEKELKMKNEI
jgi:NAD-dependent SIR2 family protein deacetylase